MLLKFNNKGSVLILFLTISLAWLFKIEIYIGILTALKITKSPHVERSLGELYALKGQQYNERAAKLFEKALYGYRKNLPLSPPEQRKWIEYILGTHYECGRGVDEDLHAARQWYLEAAKKGKVPTDILLQRIESNLQAKRYNCWKPNNNTEN